MTNTEASPDNPPTDKTKRQFTKRKILISNLIFWPLLFLMCGGTVRWVNNLPTPTPAPETDKVVVPGGPVETQVPAEKTASADQRATISAEPTNTARPEADPAVAEYISWAQKTSESIGESSGVISTQFSAAGENILLIRDQDWILKTSLALAMMNVTADSIRAQNPPAEMADAHKIALAIADELTAIYEITPRAIDNLDVENMGLAAESMTKVGQLAPLWAAAMAAAMED